MGSGDWVSHKVRKRFMVVADSNMKKGSESEPISCVQIGGDFFCLSANNSTIAAEMTNKRESEKVGRGKS